MSERKIQKFPETDARSINVDNSEMTGPLFFYTSEDDPLLSPGVIDPSETLEALDPIFKSAFRR